MASSRIVDYITPGPPASNPLDESQFLLPKAIMNYGGHGYVFGTDATDSFRFDIVQDEETGTLTTPGGYSEPAIGWTPIAANTYLDFPNTPSLDLFNEAGEITLWCVIKPVRSNLTARQQQWAFSDGTGSAASMAIGMANVAGGNAIIWGRDGNGTVTRSAAIPGGLTEPDRWLLVVGTFTDTTVQCRTYRKGTSLESATVTRTSSPVGDPTDPLRVGYAWGATQDLPVLACGVVYAALTKAEQDELYKSIQIWCQDLEEDV